VIGDQGVQRRNALHTLGQPAPHQHPASRVDQLDVVMGLGPVIPDEQHVIFLLQQC